MKGSHIIIFLLAVFFTPVFLYAGKTLRDKNQSLAASSNTHAHAYPKNIDQDQLPAIIATNNFFASAFSSANGGTQKNFNWHKIYSAPLNYPLPRVCFSNGINNFFSQEKYLFCIYPSHNFW